VPCGRDTLISLGLGACRSGVGGVDRAAIGLRPGHRAVECGCFLLCLQGVGGPGLCLRPVGLDRANGERAMGDSCLFNLQPHRCSQCYLLCYPGPLRQTVIGHHVPRSLDLDVSGLRSMTPRWGVPYAVISHSWAYLCGYVRVSTEDVPRVRTVTVPFSSNPSPVYSPVMAWQPVAPTRK